VFKKILAWWHRHPAIKTTIVGTAGAAAVAASQGAFGPKAAVVAGAVSAVYGLFVKRPQDVPAPAAPAEVEAQ
jgi:hypothetical protein